MFMIAWLISRYYLCLLIFQLSLLTSRCEAHQSHLQLCARWLCRLCGLTALLEDSTRRVTMMTSEDIVFNDVVTGSVKHLKHMFFFLHGYVAMKFKAFVTALVVLEVFTSVEPLGFRRSVSVLRSCSGAGPAEPSSCRRRFYTHPLCHWMCHGVTGTASRTDVLPMYRSKG